NSTHAVIDAIDRKFPAQGILQGKFSPKKKIYFRTRINTDDSQSTRESAGKMQGILLESLSAE
ncbi:MAG TPA: hypothetical protein VJU82_15740, partial [Acidobacteriaceae bacterium]|nr:hypothetical protein [Acidobacteriaceae bacterium]